GREVSRGKRAGRRFIEGDPAPSAVKAGRNGVCWEFSGLRAHQDEAPCVILQGVMMSSNRRQGRRGAISAGTLNFLLGAVCGGALCLALTQLFPALLFGEAEEPDVAHYREVRDFARANFVREVDPEEMLDDALQGMLSSLDEYSRYYDEVDSRTLNRETVGRYMGLGIVLKRPISEGRILFPLPDSPAEAAGVRVGDLIVAVNGSAIPPSEFRTEDQVAKSKAENVVASALADAQRGVFHLGDERYARQLADAQVTLSNLKLKEQGLLPEEGATTTGEASPSPSSSSS
ncbi:MAG: PDZ domain-containing protein, partial [Planctomycetota bacterium]